MFSGCVVTDARRGELYWARYIDGVRVRGPEVAGRSELGHLPSASLGDVELLGDPDRRHSGDTVLSASVLGACAIQLVARHSRQGGSDPAVPEPIYLRRPDIGRARG